MSSPFVGQIKIFAGSFAPRGYVFCNGQLLSIADYEVLFVLLGTTYGGDGQTTFGVPDMRGRFPLHFNGTYVQGQEAGAETVQLTAGQLPSHSHTPVGVSSSTGGVASPSGNLWAANGNTGAPQFAAAAPNVDMAATAVSMAGSSLPHENMPPFLVVSYIIATEGIFPSQN